MYRLRKLGKKERKFLGVCGGISKYIDTELDPVVIRLLWVILTIFAIVPMVLLYLILGMVLKIEEYDIN